MSDLKRLHEIEDEARWANEAEQFELSRQYTRLLNEMWKKPIDFEDVYAHEDRRPRPFTGTDPFRAGTHYWLMLPDGSIFDVVDAEGPNAINGFAFERVS